MNAFLKIGLKILGVAVLGWIASKSSSSESGKLFDSKDQSDDWWDGFKRGQNDSER